MDDLRPRLANRVQLTSDGHKAYLEAVEGAFGGDVDYAQLVKIYGTSDETGWSALAFTSALLRVSLTWLTSRLAMLNATT